MQDNGASTGGPGSSAVGTGAEQVVSAHAGDDPSREAALVASMTDGFDPRAWDNEPFEKRLRIAAELVGYAKDSYEHARKMMALGMSLMDGALVEVQETLGIAEPSGSYRAPRNDGEMDEGRRQSATVESAVLVEDASSPSPSIDAVRRV